MSTSAKSWLVGRVFSIVLPGILLWTSASAQDTHYWNLSYGTQATLLGGTVIGSASDLSATYYNPGMLAVNREEGLLLGANVYTFQRFSIDGTDRSTSSSDILPSPGLVAGRIPADSAALGGIAYSILNRQFFNTSIESRIVGPFDAIGGDGAPEQYVSDLSFDARLTEVWVGATLFRLLRPGLGVGISNYVAYRGQSLRSTAVTGALLSGGSLSSASRVSAVDYYNVRLLWKLGVGLDLGALTVGATVTTPSVNLFGSGSGYYSLAFDGVASASDSARTQTLVGTNQEDLTARFRSSWAVGVGAAYRLGNVRLHFSAEWYAAVSRFDILDTSPFVGQSDGQSYEASVVYGLKSVLNFGFGIEYHVSESTSLYGSCITDFSGLPADSKNMLAVTVWDLYHIAGGAVLKLAPFDLTLGLSYSGGSGLLKDIPWRRESQSTNSLVQLPGDARVRSTTITGILAVTFKL